jgi:multimeric flavodoxin WrbA
MKLLGICGSPRKEENSNSHTMVVEVLKNTGLDYELVSLRNKSISGCIACLQCAGDNVCKVKDDMAELRQSVVEADAYVIAAPNYFNTLNALTHAFLERWFQFRHNEGDLLWGKLGVAVGVGGIDGSVPAQAISSFFLYNFIETVAQVSGQGPAPCYSCGYGETCGIGVPRMVHGDGVSITPEITPDVTKQPDVMQAAAQAGQELGRRLSQDFNRQEVATRMQRKMMQMMGMNV